MQILNILFRCSDLYQVEDVLRLIGSDEEAIPSGSDDDRLDSDDSDLEDGDLNDMFTDGEYDIQSKYADDYCDDNDNDNDYNYEGYVYKFYISGDNTLKSHVTDAYPAISKSGAVVLNLVKGLPHGIHVYFDNYFASPELLLELKQNGFDATCTIRSNRNRNCPLKSKKQLKKEGRGSFDYQSSDGIVIASWYDNTVVNLASNKCSVMPIHQVLRYSAEKKAHVHIQCPSIVKAYNKSMEVLTVAT